MKKYIFIVSFMLSLLVVKHVDAFSDVKNTHYFYDAVQWGKQQQIISGFSDGTFKPHQPVTHRQFIKMYTNSFDFEQTQQTNTFSDYYKTLASYGIEFFYTNETQPISRGEVAVLLHYAIAPTTSIYSFSLSDLAHETIEQAAQYLLTSRISTGQTTGQTFAETFGAQHTLTRAQAITFFYRLSQSNMNNLADYIARYKAPALFEGEPIRSYDIGNDVTYHVMEDGVDLQLAITYKQYLVGGYHTKVGETVHGYTIGTPHAQPISTIPYSVDYATYPADTAYYVTVHVDEHMQQTIRAVSWLVATPTFFPSIFYAANLTTATHATNVAFLYRDLVNEFRLKHALHPLEEHSILTAAAKAHSEDMAANDYFDHHSLQGLTPQQRVQQAGGVNLAVGENISAGYPTVFISHTGLINSIGHRNNMLNPYYKYVGYGWGMNPTSRYLRYYTTKFAADF